MSNKYLEKLASIYSHESKLLSTYLRRAFNKGAKSHVLSGLGGGAAGGYAGARNKDDSKTKRVVKGLSGALAGFYGGLAISGGSGTYKAMSHLKKTNMAGLKKVYDKANAKLGSGGGAASRIKRGIHDIKKDLNLPASVKTKADAHRHFKREAMKHHPDRGGDPAKMAKVNAAWTEFKSHPDGFEKLASSNNFLDKIAEMN